MTTALHVAVWLGVILLGAFTVAFILALAVGMLWAAGTWYELYKKEIAKHERRERDRVPSRGSDH